CSDGDNKAVPPGTASVSTFERLSASERLAGPVARVQRKRSEPAKDSVSVASDVISEQIDFRARHALVPAPRSRLAMHNGTGSEDASAARLSNISAARFGSNGIAAAA